MTPERIRQAAWAAVQRRQAPPQHLHHMRLRDAFTDMPAGTAARFIAEALEAAYGRDLGRAIADCISIERKDS